MTPELYGHVGSISPASQGHGLLRARVILSRAFTPRVNQEREPAGRSDIAMAGLRIIDLQGNDGSGSYVERNLPEWRLNGLGLAAVIDDIIRPVIVPAVT